MRVGVGDKLGAMYRPVKRGWVTNVETGTTQVTSFTGTSKCGDLGVRGLHRKVLLEALAEELPPNTVRFSSKLASIKTETLKDSSTVALLELEDGTLIRAKAVIGCDGVHSVVAQWLGLSGPIDSGRAAVRGLSVFPQGHGFDHEVRQFVKQGKRAGFLPLNDTDVYWFTTHYAAEEKELAVGDPLSIQREVTNNLAKSFPPEFLRVVHQADLSTLSWAPLKYRVPWALVTGQAHKGPITVAGDAFHPMTPDLAQGGGAALEDAVVLARNLAAAGLSNAERGVEQYVKERRWRAVGLIIGAYLSGWVQQGGRAGLSGWAVNWFRDHVFYRFVQPKIVDSVQYDCGVLPSVA
ncbi:uncharacterized protein LOC109824339 [Asparagus officinalis]|uniref:uncharacterized protein LOC109824339 n=1 Tax=Asparagus officinalis TaxID=4686 RepID=UPI00098E02CF|nr:uncharacterized protein LOC109824339 [Asparagus officinalis]